MHELQCIKQKHTENKVLYGSVPDTVVTEAHRNLTLYLPWEQFLSVGELSLDCNVLEHNGHE